MNEKKCLKLDSMNLKGMQLKCFKILKLDVVYGFRDYLHKLKVEATYIYLCIPLKDAPTTNTIVTYDNGDMG